MDGGSLQWFGSQPVFWSHAVTSMNIKSNVLVKLAVGKIRTNRTDQQAAVLECLYDLRHVGDCCLHAIFQISVEH